MAKNPSKFEIVMNLLFVIDAGVICTKYNNKDLAKQKSKYRPIQYFLVKHKARWEPFRPKTRMKE